MEISGWGKYPRIDSDSRTFESEKALRRLLAEPGPWIAFGMGRSYGDSALGRRVALTRRFDKMLAFDEQSGWLTCESGLALDEILRVFLPRGWFPAVTPGTRFITVGGAIASDVHGKNHHRHGCFSRFVGSLDIMLPDGTVKTCSESRNTELFRATCGGMGLTGVILRATIQLQPVPGAWIRETVIRCRNLEQVFGRFEGHAHATYSVAWIDCLTRGADVGRSVLLLGEHASGPRRTAPAGKPLNVPCDLPGFVLNRHTVRAFNQLYYHLHPGEAENRLVAAERFFYPLDRMGNWNRIYGRRGFTQYQFVLPKPTAFAGLQTILQRLAEAGLGSFLGVLKLFGPENDNLLSFPMEGYTLAVDLKIEPRLFAFLDELDEIVLDCGGRIYLTKDVRMPRRTFVTGYPRWRRFEAVRRAGGMKTKFQSLQSLRLGV